MGAWVSSTPQSPLPPFTSIVGDAGGVPFDYEPSGKTYAGLSIKGRSRYGLAFMAGHGEAGQWIPADVAQPVQVRDVIVDTVLADPPGSTQGRAEACFWIGNTARIDRIYGANARIGIWTGSRCSGTVISNAYIDVRSQPGAVGLYAEHETDFLYVTRSTILADGNGINAEWWYGGRGSRRLVIEDCTIQSTHGWCVYLDAGTYGCVLRRLVLKGMNGIAEPAVLAAPQPNLIEWSTISTYGLGGQKSLMHGSPMGA